MKFFSCTHVTDKDGDFLATKMKQSKRWFIFVLLWRVPQVLFDANQKEHGYCGK